MSVRIAGLQKLTLLDYPGRVACTVFLEGCNLRCPFCHNASLVLPRGDTPEITQDEFFAFLKKRQGIIDGVCVTGGEPLLYPDIADFLAQIRSIGYRVKLDTNGSLPERLEPILAGRGVDYVAMDIKNSPADYKKATGIDIDVSKFLQSIELIKNSGVEHEFRTTLVNGIHTDEDIASMARLVGDSPYFLQGFINSGDLINGAALSAFSKEEMSAFCDTAKQFAPNCQVRGV